MNKILFKIVFQAQPTKHQPKPISLHCVHTFKFIRTCDGLRGSFVKLSQCLKKEEVSSVLLLLGFSKVTFLRILQMKKGRAIDHHREMTNQLSMKNRSLLSPIYPHFLHHPFLYLPRSHCLV
jgi:hypothetical protein